MNNIAFNNAAREIFRFRAKISVDSPASWLSQLDLLRAVERSLRRARLPLRYSEGFNPHPLISWGPAHPVGLRSLGEFFDVEFTSLPADDWEETLNSVMPPGLRLLESGQILPSMPSLMASLNRTVYYMEFPSLSHDEIKQACEEVLNEKEIIITRRSPKGLKTADIRPGILKLAVKDLSVTAYCLIGEAGSPKPYELPRILAPNTEALNFLRAGLFIAAKGEK
jgi:radical SAM-linked protein